MNMDVATLLSNFHESISAPLQETSNALRESVQLIESQSQSNLAELTNAKLRGEISQAEFDIELSHEKLVLEAQLISQEIVIKSALQTAIDAAFSTLAAGISAETAPTTV